MRSANSGYYDAQMRIHWARCPRTYDSIRPARRAISGFAADCGFCGTALSDIESATGEALANAAEHGDRNASTGIDITASFDGVRLVIEIADHGAGFDARAALERPQRPPAERSTRGFGIFLMRSLMDSVSYSDNGSRIQLVKRLDKQPAHCSR